MLIRNRAQQMTRELAADRRGDENVIAIGYPSASRSIEVAVRKLTGAPGSRSLGQPFHRSNPTIENSVGSSAPVLATETWTALVLYSARYLRVVAPTAPFPPLFYTHVHPADNNYLGIDHRGKTHPRRPRIFSYEPAVQIRPAICASLPRTFIEDRTSSASRFLTISNSNCYPMLDECEINKI
ncbi:unnamed protein product [Xylocopa violacea]|uniref:Uncharacterized protein n=1 Tax=Xylocopa violacea TaxID=135666 RepID=A0ABP1MXZ8_XYLVO